MLNWDGLKSVCADCTRCGLCETRHNVVFGVGNEDADIMFVGEGPGEQEDLQGQPFVTPGQAAGRYALCIIDLSRERRTAISPTSSSAAPPQPRPLETEQDACIGYLRNQVELVKPKIIVCLGRIAAKRLIDPNYLPHHETARPVGGAKRRLDDGHLSPRRRSCGRVQAPETFDDLLAIGRKSEVVQICEKSAVFGSENSDFCSLTNGIVACLMKKLHYGCR